ncbi:MAG: exonuclease SbcCD subunit D C-terminal domain-containing protein [Burkholderiales bacterium]|uniref:Nuclease SbcCD subunit D n=1 Tax=Janthinobacterium tructae TaxID=2590869 RepID=A0A4Y6RMY5_9BURK|nr:exonuclease SbcCD subunit D C-terminal domain-containing protein [Janthinobacterium tructae]MBH1985154.1 exonuclease SbcCD subunit D C-terminal domain-containing protein [Burkholderiales bacterium]MBH1993911.1 exonuclease SbcCD subunit D C-terminal domain-containing protein [Burkholderiales bacterium]MBH2069843.1 exonuclease SbcCD subunit D C-terminal domain-containing protein [Burkholderiales bacterium]QDG73804.1 exonuclease subunit SbcD [Janthinobacterium tructae]
MRLLHTSDWHLGQTLHNYERGYEHQRFLDWLLDTLVAERVDVLLVAGDVFDNANPSAASQKQLYVFLQQARARLPALQLIVVAGNHDSAGRLEAPAPLLAAHGTHVIGHLLRGENGDIDLERLLLPLSGADGRVQAWCLAVPFLRPGDVPKLPAGDTQDAYLGGIALLYRQLTDLALARRQPGQAILAMGHCHMVGGEMSNDSERRIVIGGTEMLPSGIFDTAIAYAALGHLHKAQAVGGQEHIRYCGSPIPLSFAEVNYRHQVLCLDIDGETLQSVRVIEVPRAVPLLRVPATPAPIAEVLAQLAALDVPDAPAEAQPLLEVRVRLDAPEPGLRTRIETALDGKPVRLAKIETSSTARSSAPENMTLDQLSQLQPDDIFRRLYQQKYAKEAPPELLSALAELLLPGA